MTLKGVLLQINGFQVAFWHAYNGFGGVVFIFNWFCGADSCILKGLLGGGILSISIVLVWIFFQFNGY